MISTATFTIQTRITQIFSRIFTRLWQSVEVFVEIRVLLMLDLCELMHPQLAGDGQIKSLP